MSSSTGYNILPVFGTGYFGRDFDNEDEIKAIYQTLIAEGCYNIDTARLYTGSEEILGRTGASEEFIIDSKTPGGFRNQGEDTGQAIYNHARESIERLKTNQLDIFYFHAPDPTLDLQDQLSGVQKAYEEGIFRRFGLSNFSAEQVEEVYNIAKGKGWVLPTVSKKIVFWH